MLRTQLKRRLIIRSFVAFLFPLLVIAGNYTVKKWDTIWDLSGKYLGDPYSWERIWAANSHINDPHWIYPGDKLNIPGLESSSQPVSGDSDNSLGGESQGSNVNTTDLKYTVPSLNGGYTPTPSSQSLSSDSYKNDNNNFNSKSFTEQLFRQISFLWDKPNSQGVILPGDAYIYEKKEVGTFREFVDIKCIIESDAGYAIGDTVEIIHPIKTQKHKGQITKLIKKVALATVSDKYTSASGQQMMKIRIFKLWDSVVNKDRVVKAEPIPSMIVENISDPDRKVLGKLLVNAEKSEISYVYKPFIMDIGKSEGVNLGDIFLVYKDDGSEVEKIPTAMGFIIHSTDISSTLLITNMKDIVRAGDQVSLFKRVTLR